MNEALMFIFKGVIIYTIALSLALSLAIIVTKTIKKNYKVIKYAQVESFSSLLSILHSIIEVEITMYEQNIFNERGGLTNSNFMNFYEDICQSIESHLSPDLIAMMTQYVTEDFIYTLIARKVKAYLTSKVV